ncbi:MAG: hypothetical protein VB048_02100, partial [Bacteroidaceae bacterium]|nr:hypothetical protein [Bacteroidaceae bacterium]
MAKRFPVWSFLFLLIASLISIFPFYWMIVSATNTSKDITLGKLTFGNHLFENVRNVFSTSTIGLSFSNYIYLALLITFAS